MTIILTKSAGTNSTTTTSSSASPIIEDYYITPDDNTTNNYNDDEETTTTTTDGDSSNYDDDDDTISLSTTGTDDRRNPLDKLTQHDIDTSQHSTTSSNSTTSTTGGHSYIDNLLAQEILHDYNDGDLQILNALVNKLHEADVARRKREEAKAIEAEQQRRIAGLAEGRGEYNNEVEYCVEDDDEEDYYSCCEDHCGTNQHVHHHHTPQRRNRHTAATNVTAAISAATADLPSEMPLHPPSFSPLTPTNNNTNSNTTTNDKRELSISSVDSSLHGPSIELVPTSQIQHILPSWNQSWKEERLEWKLLLDESQRAKRERSIRSASAAGRRFRRSNSTATVVNGSASKRSGNATTNHDNVTTTTTTVRRNRSAPNNTTIRVWGGTTTSIPSNTTNNLTTLRTRSSTTYQNRYGKPKPITTTPNPIVTKSSKKIHRRHARYALTAGMMLGVRESVGGANGVECELEAKMWEESEVEDGFIIENIMEGRRKLTSARSTTSEEKNRDKKEQKQVRQRIEVVLGPLKVSTLDNTPSNDEQDDELSQCTQEAQQYHDNFLTTQCERISKYKFSPQTFYLGSNTSEPLPHKYKFKVYAPVVFQRIRTLFGVEKQTFLHSICGKFNLYEFASNAKSGQFFFYSHDGRYMIKTLTYTEQKFLRLILPAYYRHLTRHPHTFLTHFYGLYRVCMPNADNTRLHFVIMRSVFHTEKKIDRVWDLKGSTVGRKSEEGESVLKDLDILEEGKKLRFKHGSEREAFLKQLEVDAAFLATMGIMDYSLLLGLHNDCDDGCCSTSTSGGGAGSAIDQITPTQSVRKRLDTGDDSLATKGSTELPMTNTPHRRNVLMRKTINGTSPPKPPPPPSLASAKGGGGGRSSPMKSSPPLSSLASNPITSMSDLGIQGGTPLRPETYYCGIIDILQYYNARKMGETVIKKAAGGDADNISCVDPETYGKRFVKFIGDLAE